MLSSIKLYTHHFLHLFFPHTCIACGSDNLNSSDVLCLQCLHKLPETNFFSQPNNPVEKTFYGRLNIHAAAAGYYFTKDALIQHLMVELKYKKNKKAGYFLGRMIGLMMQQSNRFNTIDFLVPLPLNPKKEVQRGYNQSTIICDGIASVIHKPILTKTVIRTHFTATQTKQNRIHRWQNMENAFAITNTNVLEGKHILLVDDVVTTGATLEACGNAILAIGNTQLSIATVAYTI